MGSDVTRRRFRSDEFSRVVPPRGRTPPVLRRDRCPFHLRSPFTVGTKTRQADTLDLIQDLGETRIKGGHFARRDCYLFYYVHVTERATVRRRRQYDRRFYQDPKHPGPLSSYKVPGTSSCSDIFLSVSRPLRLRV